MRPVEVRDLDTEDLYLKVAELKEEFFNLRFRFATGQLDDYKRLKRVKRDIARVRTIIREREIAAYEEEQGRATAPAQPAEEAEVETGD